MKKIGIVKGLVLLLTLIVSVCFMSGCSFLGPKDTKGLIDRYKANQEKIENFHMDGKIDMVELMTVDSQDVKDVLGTEEFEMPLNMDFGLDVGKESSHGNINMAISLPSISNETMKEKVEMYIDQKNNYVYTKAEGQSSDAPGWQKEAVDPANSLASLSDLDNIDSSSWENFKFKELDDGGYELSASVSTLKDAEFFDGISGYLGDTTVDDLNVELSDKGEVKYVFDKKYNLTNIDMTDVNMSGSADMGSGLGNLQCSINMNISIDLSKYNELDKSAYEIPKSVMDEAVEGSDMGSLFDDTTDTDTDDTPSDDVETPKDGEGETPSGSATVLDGSKVQGENNKYCFVVGTDVAPGTYKVYKKSGSGVLSVVDAKTFKDKYSFKIGFGLDDDMKDGEEVKLENGDEVYVTSELIVDLK